MPPSVLLTVTVSKPAIRALAGLVPCAVSGAKTLVRRWPRSRKYAAATINAANSPWAPAAGWSDTAGNPEISPSICCSSNSSWSNPCSVSSGWYGCRSARPGRDASRSFRLGLYFIVQDPKG